MSGAIAVAVLAKKVGEFSKIRTACFIPACVSSMDSHCNLFHDGLIIVLLVLAGGECTLRYSHRNINAICSKLKQFLLFKCYLHACLSFHDSTMDFGILTILSSVSSDLLWRPGV